MNLGDVLIRPGIIIALRERVDYGGWSPTRNLIGITETGVEITLISHHEPMDPSAGFYPPGTRPVVTEKQRAQHLDSVRESDRLFAERRAKIEAALGFES